MKIAIIVEGKTEKVFKEHLNEFLKTKLAGKMPKLNFVPQDGRIPTNYKLKKLVENLLKLGNPPADAVIALTDVYTGTNPPDFSDAADANAKMREWVGNESRFHPHAAQHDFEAWLIPYWKRIQDRTGTNEKSPGNQPELINHGYPPAHRLHDLYRRGGKRDYVKTREVGEILKGQNLLEAANVCRELMCFLNTILRLWVPTEQSLIP